MTFPGVRGSRRAGSMIRTGVRRVGTPLSASTIPVRSQPRQALVEVASLNHVTSLKRKVMSRNGGGELVVPVPFHRLFFPCPTCKRPSCDGPLHSFLRLGRCQDVRRCRRRHAPMPASSSAAYRMARGSP